MNDMPSLPSMGVIFVLIVLVFILFSSIRVLREYERAVVFRLGRLYKSKGPGLIILIPILDTMERIDTRVLTHDVPSQDVITRDNVSVKVNAVIYSRVVDPVKAIIEVENYLYATSQLAQTKLRDILGQVELDDLLSNRDEINDRLQIVLDQQTDPWGIKISTVELKHVDLPPEMVRAMARQAEAERERRAKIISAEGEMQASQKLSDAAKILSENPASLQLRYLQTLIEIAGENNTSTTIFPIPIDLISLWIKGKDQS
jgi:regulator of protease activity HflC (stomatin/prohibitin superfamily)